MRKCGSLAPPSSRDQGLVCRYIHIEYCSIYPQKHFIYQLNQKLILWLPVSIKQTSRQDANDLQKTKFHSVISFHAFIESPPASLLLHSTATQPRMQCNKKVCDVKCCDLEISTWQLWLVRWWRLAGPGSGMAPSPASTRHCSILGKITLVKQSGAGA